VGLPAGDRPEGVPELAAALGDEFLVDYVRVYDLK
jgi:hypothetical protein